MENLFKDEYEKALLFAKAAHGGQTRKYTGEPYWMHLVRVAKMVADTKDSTPDMVTAALLHDVLEDTLVTPKELIATFGPMVASYVHLMTDPGLEAGNRAKRKAMTVDRLREAPAEVKTIKLADLLDNAPSIIEHDPKFARVFLREKTVLLEALKGGDEDLYNKAAAVVLADIYTS